MKTTEPVVEHQIEEPIRGGPPRDIRLPVTTTLLIVLASALFCVFLYGGARAVGEAVRLGWLDLQGRNLRATILQVTYQQPQRTPSGAKSGAVPTGIVYLATLPNGDLVKRSATIVQPSEDEGVGLSAQAPVRQQPAVFNPKVGDRLTIRYADWRGQAVVQPWSSAARGKAVFLAGLGLVIICVCVVLLLRMAQWLTLRMRLLRLGHTAVGTVLHKYSSYEDSPKFIVRFGFADMLGNRFEREEECSPSLWRRFEVGQPVTVLYEAQSPAKASLYRTLCFAHGRDE